MTARAPPPAAAGHRDPPRPRRPGDGRDRSPPPSAPPSTLDLLHALTEADALATGPAAWGEWKAALVADLVARTHSVLRGHAVAPPPQLTAVQADAGSGSGELAVTLAPRRRTASRSRSRPPTGSACSPPSPACSACTASPSAARHDAVGGRRRRCRSGRCLPEFGDGAGRRGAARGRAHAPSTGRSTSPTGCAGATRPTPTGTAPVRAVAPPRVDVVAGASDTRDRPRGAGPRPARPAAPDRGGAGRRRGRRPLGPGEHAGQRGGRRLLRRRRRRRTAPAPTGPVEVARRVPRCLAGQPLGALHGHGYAGTVFATLSDRLSATLQEPARQGPAVRGRHRRDLPRDPDRAARGRRRAAGRPRVRRRGQGARRRRRGLPGAQPGPAGHQDRQRGARRDPRRRDPAAALRQDPADRDHAGRPPGRRQDDARRQAGAAGSASRGTPRCSSPPTSSAPTP